MRVPLLPQPAALDPISQLEEVEDYLPFEGELIVPSVPLAIPKQDFTAFFAEHSASFENQPQGFWPKITIGFATQEQLGEHKAKDFFALLPNHQTNDLLVTPSSDKVEAVLLCTRVVFCLYKAGKCRLDATGFGRLFEISLNPPLEAELQELLLRAKLSRKLRYIEKVFNVRLNPPAYISPDDVRSVEIVFRGITEGEFSIRASDITFQDINPSEIDFRSPPFHEVGAFSRRVWEYFTLFGKRLNTGPVTVTLNNAELASPLALEGIRNGLNAPIDVRFEVLDNQVLHRFEAYAGQPQRRRTQRLTQFKYELGQEEPQELVDLIDEPLQRNVSSREASQIAVGWTQYCDLPDRYWPQEPERDVTAGKWRVPIYLVYSNGEGGAVGEVVIDEKTGVIVSHTPVDELRSKGRALAEHILHA